VKKTWSSTTVTAHLIYTILQPGAQTCIKVTRLD